MRRPFQQGDIIDDAYEAQECIGKGGFGFVYRARQLSMDRDVALKVLSPSPGMPDSSTARFRREVLAVRKLTHPNTVRIYEFSETRRGLLYYTMEYLEGETLEERVDDAGPLPPSTVRDILVQTLNSLAEAHGHGIVHRDLKPANVMLVDYAGEANFVKVLDFGIAKAMRGGEGLPDNSLTATGKIVGTLRYMAPEQAEEGDIGPYTDIYALSLVAVELLTGQTVLEDCSSIELIKTHTSPEPIQLPREIADSALGEVLRKGLEKPLDARYSNADAMRAALESIDDASLADEPVATGPNADTVTMKLPDLDAVTETGEHTIDETPPRERLETVTDDSAGGATAVTGPPDEVTATRTAESDESTRWVPGAFGPLQYAAFGLAVIALLAAGYATIAGGNGSDGNSVAPTDGAATTESEGAGAAAKRDMQRGAGSSRTVAVELAADVGTAEVYADDQKLGTTPVDLELDEPKQLRLEAEGYATKILEVRPEDGPRLRVDMSASAENERPDDSPSTARGRTDEADGPTDGKEPERQGGRASQENEPLPTGAAGSRPGRDRLQVDDEESPDHGASHEEPSDEEASNGDESPTSGAGSASNASDAPRETSDDSAADDEWAPIKTDDSSKSSESSSDSPDPPTDDGESDGKESSDEDIPVF